MKLILRDNKGNSNKLSDLDGRKGNSIQRKSVENVSKGKSFFLLQSFFFEEEKKRTRRKGGRGTLTLLG